jgi:hypothetical protein
MSLRESLIASGALVPADRVEQRPPVKVDLGPYLPLLGTEGRPSKNANWRPPFVESPFSQEDAKP